MILFAALAVDLSGRVSRHSTLETLDMASTKASEEECAALIKDGIEGNEKEAGCVLNFTGVRVEARVKKVSQTERKSLDWSTPTNIPKKPADKDCSVIKDEKTKAACTEDNRKAEEKYLADLGKAQKARDERTGEKFQVDIVSVIEDCSECDASVSYTVARSESPLGISKTIHAKAIEQYKLANEKKKKAKAEAVAAENLKRDIDKCRKTADGKPYKDEQAQLDCQATRLDDSTDEAEQAFIFAEIKMKLRQKIETGNEAERANAIAMAQKISESGLPPDLQNAAKTMAISGKYQDAVLKISQNLANAPQGQARMAILQQLQAVGSAYQNEMRQAGLGNVGATSAAGSEYMYWYGSLSKSIQQAATNPQAVLDSHGYYGRDQLNVDINQRSRTLRGIPGDPLVNTSNQFSELTNSTNAYVQNQIRSMNQQTQQTQQNGQRFGPNGIPNAGSPAGNGNNVVYNSNGQPNYSPYNLNNGQPQQNMPTNQQRPNGNGGYRSR